MSILGRERWAGEATDRDESLSANFPDCSCAFRRRELHVTVSWITTLDEDAFGKGVVGDAISTTTAGLAWKSNTDGFFHYLILEVDLEHLSFTNIGGKTIQT